MPDFYMERYTGLKWVKKEYSLPLTLKLVCHKVFKEILSGGPKIQAKFSSTFEDCVLGEGQLYTLPLMVQG